MASDLNFNYNSYYRFRGDQSDNSASIGAYAGFVSLTMFKKGNNKPVFRMILDRNITIIFKDLLKNLLKAQPNTNLTFELKAWNNENKKFEKDVFITFNKDEKQRYSFELNSKKLNEATKFKFKARGGISIGTDDLSEADSSANDVKAFIEFLDKELPILLANSRFNMPEKQYGGANDRSSTRPSENIDDNDEPY